MKHTGNLLIVALLFLVSCQQKAEQQVQSMYSFPEQTQSRWISFENPQGEKGKGGMENFGAKGHPQDSIGAGATQVLMDIKGSGVINRMWVTINDRSPEMLRSLRIDMYWDGESKPAVSAPFGDFFGIGLGRMTAFENALFADPEGRSFVSYIRMPFKTGAKITLTNESDQPVSALFYDIDYLLTPWKKDNLYFHCYWNRDTATTPGVDYTILPDVSGKGRFLGTNIGVNANPAYGDSWWGEGEVKMYLDGDTKYPTLAGTGTEDYIGTAWGQGQFITRYSGCSLADRKNKQWAFYRYHIPDPIYFGSDCRVTIQQIGGAPKAQVIEMQEKGAKLIPVTIHDGRTLHPIYKKDTVVNLATIPYNGWTNFYRSDDVSSTAYFYLDQPTNDLPALKPRAYRVYHVKTGKE
ncbi:glycoside hydrolase family 172 protein [Prolixibacter denitrificans]|uniref:DUF2961 family protein n=1 Tax=Prolixibacter denitrificans TaxID=1541063 RepID=A0A2P8CE70_9BACT|nr:glycoside hydrolase family 172 protein [Prolixibacter denitrificans]PSK83261.1 Protein of unknown function (DUF2961) [Prolixibacter denitrificans]GET21856.1 hypothetical protein JCM18694_21020 [Prolixibacter denitrificans]